MYDPTKTNQPDYPDDYKKGKVIGHNQLCNREVEYKDTWVGYHIGTILSYLSEKHKIQITEKDDDLIQEQMEAIAKAISEGKVLRVVE